MAKITLTVKTNFGDASKGIRELGDLIEAESKKMKRALSRLKGEELEKFERQNRRVAAAVKATKGPVAALAYEQNVLAKRLHTAIASGIDPQSESLKTLKSRYAQVSSQLTTTTRAQEINTKTVRAASRAFAALSAASIAAATKGIQAYADYSESLAKLHTLTDISESQFKSLDSYLTRISMKYGKNKKELASSFHQAVSAGDSLAEALETVEVSAKVSRGGLIDTAAATDILTTATNAYGRTIVDTEKAADVYLSIIKKGKIEGEQLAQSIGQSIPLFAAAKVPIEELGAGVATLTAVGVSASEATTQLNAVISGFLKPSKRLKEELDRLGYTSGAALLKAEGLGGALSLLSSASGGAVDILAELVPNLRGLQGTLGLASDNSEIFRDALASIENGAGAADEAFRRQSEGVASGAFSLEQARVAVDNLQIALGARLMPVISRVTEGITNLLANPKKLERTIDTLIIAVISLTGFIVALGVKLAITKVAAIGLGVALKTALISSGIGIAIIAIGTGIFYLYKNWDKVSLFFQVTLAKLKEHFQIFGSTMKLVFITVFHTVEKVVMAIADHIFEKHFDRIQLLLDIAARLPGKTGAMFKNLSYKLQGFRDEIKVIRDDTRAQSDQAIAQAKKENQAVREESRKNIEAIKAEAEARRAAIGLDPEANESDLFGFEETQSGGSTDESASAGTSASTEGSASLAKRLAVLQNQEAIAHSERLKTFDTFLSARMEQEQVAAGKRLSFLSGELSRIKDLENISGAERVAAAESVIGSIVSLEDVNANERIAALEELGEMRIVGEKTVQDAIYKIQEEAAEKQKQLRDQILEGIVTSLENISGVFNNIQTIVENAATREIETEKEKTAKLLANEALTEEQRSKIKAESEKRISAIERNAAKKKAKLAVAQKAVDIGTTIITTAKAAMAAYSAMAAIPFIGPILGKVAAAMTIALGATQVAVIASTPIPTPSAETGGRFIVPEAHGVDNVGLRVNPGERVDVTPRGDDEEKITTINVHIDREVIWSITQEGLNEGIIEVRPDNLRVS